MSSTTKHEFHPDAESLSAFTEQALSERERNQVLTHLAVCGRCRQVVALAREATDAGVANPITARRAPLQPDAWWKRWRLLWVPTAVVTAFAVVSISVYVRQADHNGATIKITEQPSEQSRAGAANPSQPEQAEAVPPSLPLPALHPTKTEKPGTPDASRAARSRKQAALTERDQLTPANSLQETPPPNAQEQTLDAELESSVKPSDYVPQSPAPTVPTLREELKRQEDSRQQAEARAESRQLFAAKAAEPPGAHGANAPVPAATETITVSAAAPDVETQSAPGTSLGGLSGLSSMKSSLGEMKADRAERRINLPSGQAVVSIATATHRTLAIDKAGTLFFSEDAGNTKAWEQVVQQWTGRAVAVRIHAGPASGSSAAPAAGQLEAAPAAAGAMSTPVVLFELLNDKDQVWLSTDGKLWIAK